MRKWHFTAVVFDLDGVLIDSDEAMRQAFQAAYEHIGGTGEAPFTEYRQHLGRHMPETLKIMGLPETMYVPFVRESARLAHLLRPYQGAEQLLVGLRATGTRIAVATGKTHDRAEHALEAVGLRGYVEEVVGSDEVPHSKPAPDIVREALRRLGCAPADSLMVGDSPLDLLSGRAAGTRTAAALWGQGDAATLCAEKPDLTAASAEELADLLLEARHV
jgi:AHBA synthesis associated protein